MDWSIAITDEDLSGIEVIPLTSLNNRGFLTATLNPLGRKLIECEEVKITNIQSRCKVVLFQIKKRTHVGCILENKSIKCAFFVKEANKIQ